MRVDSLPNSPGIDSTTSLPRARDVRLPDAPRGIDSSTPLLCMRVDSLPWPPVGIDSSTPLLCMRVDSLPRPPVGIDGSTPLLRMCVDSLPRPPVGMDSSTPLLRMRVDSLPRTPHGIDSTTSPRARDVSLPEWDARPLRIGLRGVGGSIADAHVDPEWKGKLPCPRSNLSLTPPGIDSTTVPRACDVSLPEWEARPLRIGLHGVGGSIADAHVDPGWEDKPPGAPGNTHHSQTQPGTGGQLSPETPPSNERLYQVSPAYAASSGLADQPTQLW